MQFWQTCLGSLVTGFKDVKYALRLGGRLSNDKHVRAPQCEEKKIVHLIYSVHDGNHSIGGTAVANL